MKPGEKAKRLRIYISSTDKFEHTPLYELIIFTARKNGITGATVLKGVMGYGASSEIYSNKLWEITEKMPLIVEVIDEAKKIDLLIDSIHPFFEKSGKGHLLTVDETTVVLHNTGAKR